MPYNYIYGLCYAKRHMKQTPGKQVNCLTKKKKKNQNKNKQSNPYNTHTNTALVRPKARGCVGLAQNIPCVFPGTYFAVRAEPAKVPT